MIMRARASEVASDIIVLNTVIDLFHLIQPAHPDQTVCLSSIVPWKLLFKDSTGSQNFGQAGACSCDTV